MNRRLVVIDLDGATYRVIKPLVEAGKLPSFKKLLDGGAHGLLQSTVPAITPCAYSSFITGRRPGRTGIYDFVFRRPGDKGISTVNSGVLHGVPFWKVMNRCGRKVGIVNLPMTYPASRVDGFMIGCGLTAPNASGPGFCHPADLFERAGLDRSSYILKPEWRTMRYGTPDEYHGEVLKMFEARKALALRLMEAEPWDFFMLHIHAIDWLQHNFWGDDEKISGIHGKVDEFMGTVMDRAGKDAVIMVMSDHGFGPTHRTLSLSKWLMQEGFLKTKNISFQELYVKAAKKLLGDGKASRALDSLYGGLPSAAKSAADAAITAAYNTFPALHKLYSSDYMSRIDWERTTAYTYGQIGAIYLNDSVRPPAREEVMARISERLLEITDENGERLVEKVYAKKDLYEGEHNEGAPDLLIKPAKVMYFHADFDLKGVVSAPTSWRVGNHAREGIFMIKGPGLKTNAFIGDIDITDLAPTMLYAMGLPSVSGMDGKVSLGCFTDDYASGNRPARLDESEFMDAKTAAGAENYSDAIKEQLKGLGYI